MAERDAPSAADPATAPLTAPRSFALSSAQQRFWFLEQLDPGNPAHHIPSVSRFLGPLVVSVLERALAAIVERHEPLRTIYAIEDGRPVQIVLARGKFELPVVELAGLLPELRERERCRHHAEIATAPFELRGSAPIRFRLLRLGDDDYELLSAVHHIAADGYSAGIFARELVALYGAFLEERPSPLAPLHRGFRDVVTEEARRRASTEASAGVEHFRSKLEGVSPVDLPYDHHRGPGWISKGARAARDLGPAIAGRVRERAREFLTTPFTMFLAAFEVVLSRLSGQGSFTLGTPVANRPHPGDLAIIGLFVNGVVLRADVSDAMSFRDLVASVARGLREDLAHENTSFDDVLAALRPERALDRNPLFQVVFNYIDFKEREQETGGLLVEHHPIQAGSLFDLTLYVHVTEAGYRISFEFDTRLFDPETPARWLRHFETLLDAALDGPDRPIAGLPLLSEAELDRIVGFGRTLPSSEPSRVPIGLRFAEVVRRQGDAAAIVDASGVSTYADLDRLATKIAAVLGTAGVGPGAIAGVAATRSRELVALLFGIHRAGAAYLPLDPAQPSARLSAILEATGCRTIVADAAAAAGLSASATGMSPLLDGAFPRSGDIPVAVFPPGDEGVSPTQDPIRLLVLDELLRIQPGGELVPKIDPDDRAYVITTSGSTGVPKNVAISHGALAAAVDALATLVEVQSTDCVLWHTPLTFDIAGFEIFAPLVRGATIVVPPDSDAAGSPLAAGLADPRVTVVQATPSGLRQALLSGVLPRGTQRILCGGEPLPRDLAGQLRLHAARLWNVYGPTETTIWSTADVVNDDEITIGGPLAGTQVAVVDASGRLCPIGVSGELQLSGPSVALGYVGDPELTAQRFTDAPNPRLAAGRWFRTRDLARWREDGRLEFLGRQDRQFKVRGHRIEAGDVEAALRAHPEVSDARAGVLPGPDGLPRLVAWIVPSPDPPGDEGTSARERVLDWKEVWNATYEDGGPLLDPTFDVRGWIDPRSGQRFTDEVMREWVDATVARVSELKPRRVLEIGTGTGLLLFRVAPSTLRYVGIDVSGAAITNLRRELLSRGLEHVELIEAPAHEPDLRSTDRFDLVILNSVVQYFPSRAYLAEVLRKVAVHVERDGAIFIGDVRNLAVWEDAEAESAFDAAAPESAAAEVLAIVAQRMQDEEELLLHPSFFENFARDFPRRCRAMVENRRGSAPTEMNRFRYDVVLRFPAKPGRASDPVTIVAATLAEVQTALSTTPHPHVRISGLPDRRQVRARRVLARLRASAPAGTVREISEESDVSEQDPGIDPDELATAARLLGFHASISPSPAEGAGRMDVIFVRDSNRGDPIPTPFLSRDAAVASTRLSNEPARRDRGFARKARLLAHLRTRLPEAFLPSLIVLVPAIPLMTSGKVDQRRLDATVEKRQPSWDPAAPEPATAPAPEFICNVCSMAAEVLGLDRVRPGDDFFALGGHSLLAARLLARVRAALGVDPGLRAIFESPRLEDFARRCAAAVGSAVVDPHRAHGPREGPIPLTAGQRRLHFLWTLDPASPLYNIAVAIDLQGPLDRGALEEALDDLRRRFEVLRARVSPCDGRAQLVIDGAAHRPLAFHDFRTEGPAARLAMVTARETEFATLPFDLEAGPLFRVELLARTDDYHVLVIVQHHLVSDGWSLAILARELGLAYAARRAGSGTPATESIGPPPRIQTLGIPEDGAFTLPPWLESAPAMIELPANRLRPPIASHRGEEHAFALSSSLSQSLRRVARDSSTTLYAVLLAGFALLVKRLSGQRDLVLGTVADGRRTVAEEEQPGFFVDTLVLRIDVEEREDFAALVRRAQEAFVRAWEPAPLPFERVVLALAPDRDLSRSPVFQIAFELWNIPEARVELLGLRAAARAIPTNTSKFDLTLRIDDRPVLSGTVEFATDLFDRSTIAGWMDRYLQLLAGLSAAPHRPVGEASWLLPGEAGLLAGRLCGSRQALPSLRLDQHIDAVATAHPDAAAVIDAAETMTYARLVADAGVFARRLRAFGASSVAILLPRSPALITTLLAALKARVAHVPLDPSDPPARLRDLLRRSGAGLLVTLERHRALAGGLAVCCLDGASEFPVPAATTLALPVKARGPDTAYVLFTSGSTGSPKGVVVPEPALRNYVHAAIATYGIVPGDVTPLHTSIAFDLTVTSVWVPLAAGGVVRILPDGPGLDALAATLAEGPRFAFVKLTPTHLDALNAVARPAERATFARALVIGGETLQGASLKAWRAAAPDLRIFNEYGPTEATVGCVVHEVAKGADLEGTVPIGHPIQNMEVLLLDDRGTAVPDGVPGEIHLAGAGLADGYLDPEATAAAFVADPGSSASGRRYRTGDLARVNSRGDLVYLGRKDSQIKLHGHRIEPEEVRAVVRGVPGVEDAHVGLATFPNGSRRLVAWVVAGRGVTEASVLEEVANQLAEPMRPRAIVIVPQFPRTPHGKLDLRALPLPSPSTGDRPPGGSRSGEEPPATRQLLAIFRDVLRQPQARSDDDFFSLGGDSILTLQVVARARDAGLHFSTRELFERRTAATLAHLVRDGGAVPALSTPQSGVAALLPVGRWFLGQDFAEPDHWNQATAFDLDPGIVAATVALALEALVDRHATLALCVDQNGRVSLPSRRIAGFTVVPEEAGPAGVTAATTAAHRAIRLATGQVFHAVFRPSSTPAPARLVLVAHHLVVDGVSWRIILSDLERALHELREGRVPALSPVPEDAFARAAVIADLSARHGFDEEAEFWIAQVRPFLAIFGTATHREGEAAVHERTLAGELPTQLTDALARLHAGRQEILLAAFGLAAAGEFGADCELVLDIEGHGRDVLAPGEDLSRAVGWFTSIYPVRFAVKRNDPAETLAAAKDALRAIPRGGIGHQVLSESDDNVGRRLRAARPRPVLFNFHGIADVTLAPDSAFLKAEPGEGPLRASTNRRTHALEIDAIILDGRFRLSIRYAEGIHARAMIESLARSIEHHLFVLCSRADELGPLALLPSDFPLARLSSSALTRVVERDSRLADLFPLTPTQQGMYFHSLYAPGTTAYFEQVSAVVEGRIDAAGFERALRLTLAREGLLGLRVVQEEGSEPHLARSGGASLPWTLFQTAASTLLEQRTSLLEYMAEDRKTGFDLHAGPLLRAAMIEFGGERAGIVFTWHHLLFDGWSLPIILRRVLDTWKSDPALEAPPRGEFRFADHVAWLRARPLELGRKFFRDRLAGVEEPTPLTFARGFATEAGSARDTGEAEAVVSETLDRDLRRLARETGVTLGTVFAGALATLLQRTADRAPVVFGLTVSGRTAPLAGIEDAVGLFINTLPVAVSAQSGETTRDFLRRLHAELQALLEFEWMPLPDAQATSDVPAGTPLFESLLVIENYPIGDVLESSASGLRVVATAGFERTSYPLTVVVVPGVRLELRVLYDRARLDPIVAARFLDWFERVLAGFAAAPASSPLDVPLADPPVATVTTPAPAPESVGMTPAPTLLERIAATASRFPNDAAVLHADRSISHSALHRASTTLAFRLHAEGLQGGVLIGLLTEAVPERILAMLAILSTGAAFLPLDPSWPSRRREDIARRAGIRIVLCSEGAVAAAPEGLSVLVIPRIEELGAGPPFESLRPRSLPGSTPAYVMPTSGSSGEPRLVVVEHAALLAFSESAVATYGVAPGDRVLQLAGPAFDTSLEEIFPALLAGATIVVPPRDFLGSTSSMCAIVRALGITVLDLPTALWHEMTATLTPEAAEDLAGVRLVILGGEAARADAHARWAATVRHPHSLRNTYGPTETTVVVLQSTLGPPDGLPPPIGHCLPHVACRIVDRQGRPMPDLVPGELWIAGPQLARGYLADPSATQARFVTLPDVDGHPCRWFKTGDIVVRGTDGEIAFVGRKDRQIKIRGQRIEPAEIETVLRRQRGVRDALVLPFRRPDAPALRAALVIEAGVHPELAVIQASLAAELPRAFLPERFVITGTFPRTTSGKLDFKEMERLLDLKDAASTTFAPLPAPKDAQTLAAIYAEVLEHHGAGPDESFFDLGGHSLTALRLLGRIEAESGVQLPLRDLFEHPTPRALAVALRARRSGIDAPPGRRGPDLEAESRLAAPISVAPRRPPVRPERVFLTGATGFLGVHLLSALLADPRCVVTALVRASDESSGRGRLLDALRRYALPAPDDSSRLRVVTGELAKPGFGLDPRTLEAIGGGTDTIVHAAAATSFFLPYASLRDANVLGTLEVLNLAAREGVPLHLVSTAGLFLSPGTEFDEDASPPAPPTLESGYVQTKWVAEQLALDLRARGLPLAIHRLGRLIASSETLIPNAEDFVTRLLRASVELGLIPAIDLAFDATPVDYVAKAIAAAVFDPASIGENFHLVNPGPLHARDLAAAFREVSIGALTVPPEAWQRAFIEKFQSHADSSLRVLTPAIAALHLDPSGEASPAPVLRHEKTRRYLDGHGIRCPPLSIDVLTRMLRASVGRGPS